MKSTGFEPNKFKSFLQYAKNHRIPIHPENRKIGIACTLIGWASIAFIEMNLPVSTRSQNNFVLLFHFFFVFTSGTVCLLIASLFLGRNFLKVSDSTESKVEDQNQNYTKLSVPVRKSLIFWRGLIAVITYMLYSFANSNTEIIDNSAAFSSDAIMYALIMTFVLKIRLSPAQWISVAIIFLGVCYLTFFDVIETGFFGRDAISLVIALGAAASLAIIILLNSVIIQHEPPLRVAFYQCLIGFIFAAIPVCIWLILDPSALKLINADLMIQSCISGIIHAIALLFFFNAFLYTEPFLIVMLGYSIFPFAIFLSWMKTHEVRSEDLIGALLITFGGLASVFFQYKKDRLNTHANIGGYPIYLSTLRDKFRAIKQDFLNSRLGVFEYMSQRHEFNKLLFEFAKEINDGDIEKIELERGEVVFTLKPFPIKMLSDGECRSAPLEIFNFGSYEKEESALVFQAVQDGDLIIDVGANLGWYSIQLAKRFQHASIHAFEPIPQTFALLKKNITMNHLTNVTIHNFALGKVESGSTIANTSKIECRVTTLDSVVTHLNLQKIDFLKCDVEGSELDVLLGGLQSIGRFLPVIFIELYHDWCIKFGYVPNDVIQLLGRFGYDCFKISNGNIVLTENISEEEIGYNFFFLHPEKHHDLISRMSLFAK